MTELDLLAFAPHPDDAEICCGGLLAKAAATGHRTAIVDLSAGELASQGDVEGRMIEAKNAAAVLSLSHRENLGLPDGFIGSSSDSSGLPRPGSASLGSDSSGSDSSGAVIGDIPLSQLESVVSCLRRLKPSIVLAPYWQARHPDHYRSSELITQAVFFAAMKNFNPGLGSTHQVKQLLYYQMRVSFEPSFICDITDVYEKKTHAIACHKSQMYPAIANNPLPSSSTETNNLQTLVSSPLSLSSIEARDRYTGAMIGTAYGEAYLSRAVLRLDDPLRHFLNRHEDKPLYFPQQ